MKTRQGIVVGSFEGMADPPSELQRRDGELRVKTLVLFNFLSGKWKREFLFSFFFSFLFSFSFF